MSHLPASVYHYHQQTRPKLYQIEVVQQEIERLKIKKHYKKAGYQHIYIKLKKLGHHIGENKVLYLMKTMGFLQIKNKKWRRYNSFKDATGGLLPNMMNQEFKTTAPYKKPGTDVTTFPLY
jgi:hypothetical protein